MEFFPVEILDTYTDALDILVLKTKKPSLFEFNAGQYTVISLRVSGSDVMKPFSIACSPTKPYLLFATKNTGSDFKKSWLQLKKGDTIKITKARGSFVFDESFLQNVFLSGGIGITPLKSMLEYVTDKKLKNNITLLYSNKVPQDIPFLKDLQAFNSPTVHVELTITRPQDAGQKIKCRTGRIDEAMVKEVAPPQARYYICGPPLMVQAMEQILLSMRIDQSNIRKELFTGYA